MKSLPLTPQEIENLSELLTSTNKENIELGFQILSTYADVIPEVTKELILISQLSWQSAQRNQAQQLLEQHFTAAQIETWDKSFHIFHIYHNLFDKEDFEESWKWFETHEQERATYMPYIRRNSEYAGEYFAIAETIAEYYKKKLDWAERYYHIPLEHNPHDLNVLSTLAILYKDGYHNYPKALEYYDKMLAVEPYHYDALEAKGLLLFDYMKDIDKAIEVFEMGLKKHPNDANLQIWLSDAYMLHSNKALYQKGKKIIQNLLQQQPNNTFAWTIYANRLWTTENNAKEAEAAYLKVLQLTPRDHNVLGNLAELQATVYKNYEQAEEYYTKSFAIYMDDIFHLSNYISMLVLRLKELDNAKDYYQHLQSLFFGPIKRAPELNNHQWEQFKEAETLLLETFPDVLFSE